MYFKTTLQWYHLYLKATQPSKCFFLRDIPIQTLRRIYYVKGSHACALRAEQATRALHSRRVTVTNASVTTICTGYKNARKETCFAYVVDWYKTFLTFCTRKNILVADLAWWYVMYLKATPIKTYVRRVTNKNLQNLYLKATRRFLLVTLRCAVGKKVGHVGSYLCLALHGNTCTARVTRNQKSRKARKATNA